MKKPFDYISNQFTLTLASLALFFVAFGQDPRLIFQPFALGDGLFAYAVVNELGVNYGALPHMAFPFGFDQTYFPYAEQLQVHLGFLLGALFGSAIAGWNIMFVLSFPTTALFTNVAFRKLGIEKSVSWILSLAFTFIPFHVWRVEHTSLATIYSLPVALILAQSILDGEVSAGINNIFKKSHLSKNMKILGLIAVLATSGLYYAFFGILLIFAATLIRLFEHKKVSHFFKDLMVPALVGVFLALTAIKSIISQIVYGSTIPKRLPIESVAYSGQLIDSILPSSSSLLPVAKTIGNSLTGINEWANSIGSPGVRWVSDHGSIFTLFGFIALFWLILQKFSEPRSFQNFQEKENQRTRIGLIIVGAISSSWLMVPFGIQTFFSIAITAQIRAWDRIIPLWQLLLIASLGIVFSNFLNKLTKSKSRKLLRISAALGAILLIMFDTVLPAQSFYQSQSDTARSKLLAAKELASEVEQAFGSNCGIFQLPSMDFPEAANTVNLGVYEPFWVSLAGKNNHWSYGGLRGSKQGNWNLEMQAGLPETGKELFGYGYCGILVDKLGYSEADSSNLTERLSSVFGEKVQFGDGSRYFGFSIKD